MNLIGCSIPSDPEDDRYPAASQDQDEAAPSNQYLSKKDFKYIVGGIILVALIAWPLYIKMNNDRLLYQCSQNFKAISTSMSLYMTDNDECFPPAFIPESSSIYPRVDAKGRPYTWASTLVNVAGFDPKRSFRCPAADPTEVVIAEGEKDADLDMSYGMYAAYSAQPLKSASDPGNAVLIAETATGGASETYDPHPMPATEGKVRDGFLVGWSTGDFSMPPGKNPPEPSVTRLAFGNSRDGLGRKSTLGRHDDKIHVMFADGHYRLISAAKLLNDGYWTLPSH